MSASAAWNAAVKVSGTAVAVTGEACSLVTGTTYQVTNAAKRILDPSVAVVVKDGGTPVTPTSIDYLFGKVVLPAPPGGAVTIDASYLPVADIGDAKAIDVSISLALLDKSTFGSQARSKTLGLTDHAATVTRYTVPIDDIDPVTGGVQSLDARMKNGTPLLIDWLVDGTNRIRGWFKIKGYKVTAKLESLIEATLELEGDAQAAGATIGIGT